MINRILLLSVFFIWLQGCQPGPKQIDYGNDMCHYCKMTIVDTRHAAEAVTTKGKVYMFDAIECLVNFEVAQPEMEFDLLLVNDYHSPRMLIDATSSHYLISKAIPSPMGAFLSAFSSENAANAVQQEKGGQVFDWSTLRGHLQETGIVNRGD